MPLPYRALRPLSCELIRAVDARAIAELGMPGIVLMENAGRAAAEAAYEMIADPAAARVVVLCGAGNNGGDGFVVARHLDSAGVSCQVVTAAAWERLAGDAALNFRWLRGSSCGLIDAADDGQRAIALGAIAGATLILDALLGSGARGAPRGVIAELIRAANANGQARRLAIDIPSGLDADSGVVNEPCFWAEATVTYVAAKAGFASAAAARVLGRVSVAGIGVPSGLLAQFSNLENST